MMMMMMMKEEARLVGSLATQQPNPKSTNSVQFLW